MKNSLVVGIEYVIDWEGQVGVFKGSASNGDPLFKVEGEHIYAEDDDGLVGFVMGTFEYYKK